MRSSTVGWGPWMRTTILRHCIRSVNAGITMTGSLIARFSHIYLYITACPKPWLICLRWRAFNPNSPILLRNVRWPTKRIDANPIRIAMRFGRCSTRTEVTSHMLCCLFCRNVHLLGIFSQATAQVVGFPCNWRWLHRSLVPRGLNLWVLMSLSPFLWSRCMLSFALGAWEWTLLRLAFRSWLRFPSCSVSYSYA